MITIEIMGGLGNQLFQIFSLISYGLTNNISVYFQDKKDPIRIDRPFYWDNFLSCLKPFVKSACETNLPIYKENGFHYNMMIPYDQVRKPFKFYGYFQSYRYFQEKEQYIFKLIKLNEQIERVKTKYNQICVFDNTISLHFRIGDYKHQPQNHPVMDIKYYRSALQHVTDRTKRNDWNILYFYEKQDIDMVKEKIDILRKEFNSLTFTPINTEIVDYDQLLLMSLCQHNIIANSSFSWWGAYLNQNTHKTVTYPSMWFGPSFGNIKMDDMFPIGWNKVDI